MTQTKLSYSDIQSLCSLLVQGHKQSFVARYFGIHQSTVSRIKARYMVCYMARCMDVSPFCFCPFPPSSPCCPNCCFYF